MGDRMGYGSTSWMWARARGTRERRVKRDIGVQ
jgi:hypothetical protein